MGKNAFTYKCGYNGTLEERLNSKTLKLTSDECWLWIGSCDTAGYGSIRVDGKLRHATNVVYELFNNIKMPSNTLIMHSCDNPACVNPSHLILGTNLTNCRDKHVKGHYKHKTGEKHPLTKFTWNDINKIRSLKKQNIPCSTIAKNYNVNPSTIQRIVNLETWIPD